MRRFLILFLPCLALAGKIYYSDEPYTINTEEEFPQPIFEHPEFDHDYHIEEAYYFHDKKDLKKIVYKKESAYFDFNYGYSNLSVINVKPFYYPQNYTQQIQTVAPSSSGILTPASTTTSTTTQTIIVHESFAINDYGDFTYSFPSKTYTDPTKQPFLQINAVTRSKHLAYGLEISYNNNPTIELSNPNYTIYQTQTSTTQTNTTNAEGSNGQSYASKTTVAEINATVTADTVKLKVVNVPAHITLQYFPIYDGYFQPYLKAGMGLNFTHTQLSVIENQNSASTLVPLYQVGWGFMPFTYTYGAGVHIMLTESLAFTASYMKQRIDGRSTKFQVVLNNQSNSQANGPFGSMRFQFQQKTTLKEIGLVYYF